MLYFPFISTHTAPKVFPGHLLPVLVEKRSIRLSWDELACADQNGPILGYQIRRHGNLPVPSVYEALGEHNNRITITDNIKPNRPYVFSVAAFNEAGNGIFSPEIVVKTLP